MNEIEKMIAAGDMPDEYRLDDEQIDRLFKHASFGSRSKKQIILETLLQVGGGFATGHTAMTICRVLGLLTLKSTSRTPRLSKKGKRVMYYWNKAYTQALLSERDRLEKMCFGMAEVIHDLMNAKDEYECCGGFECGCQGVTQKTMRNIKQKQL